jgi:hypothetical protein
VLDKAVWEQGLREPLPSGVRRHPWKLAHGFRKYCETHAMSVMKPLNVALIISHDTGISKSYWRPTKQELLEDYLKAVDALTINYDSSKSTLQKQVVELTEKNKEENYLILKTLTEKEKETEQIKKQLEELKTNQDKMIRETESFAKIDEWINQHLDKNLPQNIELLIREYLEPDPEEGSAISKAEFARRKSKFPELAAAAEKLKQVRLARDNMQ